MNEREARDAVRPLGNCDPLPRMQEPDREPPYPHGPLASRRVTEPTSAAWSTGPNGSPVIVESGSPSGVRLWMTWPGKPEIAEAVARGLVEVAETLGFDVLDLTVAEFE